jgi:hypothetical protein
MARWAWIGFGVLLVNAAIACWVTWGRFSARSTLNATTTGQVVGVTKGYGRTPDDHIAATFKVNDVTYNVRGNSGEDSSLTASNYSIGAPITIYFNDKDPSLSSLSRGAGVLFWTAIAVMLVLATGLVGYVVFFKR